MKIYLDAGHGGSDPGAVGPHGLPEAKITGQVSDKLLALDPTLLPVPRSDLGDRKRWLETYLAPGDLLISLHVDSFALPAVNHASTWTLEDGLPRSVELAHELHPEMVRVLGIRDAGYKIAKFAVLRGAEHAGAAAMLLEMGFISNAEHEERLRQEPYLDGLAHGILRGIAKVRATANNDVQPLAQLEKLFGAPLEPDQPVTWSELAEVLSTLGLLKDNDHSPA